MNQINHLVEQKQYKEAMEVVDSIDWRRVKKVHTLCVVGEIYAVNKRYEDSKEIFLLAYHRAPIGKNILYRLIEVSLKMQDIQEAEEFYEEYLEVAPNDSTQYVLKYKISKAANASVDEQIRILEEYKEREFTERWSYELARLYYQKGDRKSCLDLCNEIILWFSEGRYVMKAMDLKNRMGQLTGDEKQKYEQQFVPNLTTVEDAAHMEDMEESVPETKYEAVVDEEAPVIESVRIDERDVNSAESLQEKISKGIRDIFNGKKKETEAAASEEEAAEEKLQDEMLRDTASEEEEEEVPDLEPEELSTPSEEEQPAEEFLTEEEEEVPGEEIPEEIQEEPEQTSEVAALEDEKDLNDSRTEIPQLEMPENLKNMGMEKGFSSDMNFNLEDMILSAATAQGIEIPKEGAQPKQPVKEQQVTEDEDYMSEEDLQSAEDEFLNGPLGSRIAEEPEEEEIRGEYSYEDDELEEDDFYGDDDDDFYEEDEESENSYEEDELDDGFYEEDEYDEADDFQEEDDLDDDFYQEEPDASDEDFADDEDDFYGDDDDDFYAEKEREEADDSEELPVVSRNPIPAEKIARTAEQRTAAVKKPEPERKTVFKEEPVKKAELKKAKRRALSQEEELELFVDSIRPQEPMDIIPREKQLTDNEKKLFTYFARVPGLREQLVETLCDVQMSAADKTSKTGNIIVMGGRETGKTRLISGLIPAICKELNLEAAKVAYVFAEQINGKDVAAIVHKMAGGFLVIENANKLKKETVNQLSKAMDLSTDGMIVILEDEKIGMRKLMARFPKFTGKFTSMINIPVFTNDELVNFAKVYTRERGYTIDQMAMLSLYNLISTNQKEDQPMNVGAVKEIIDNAISKSTGGIRKLSRNISKKRTDADGYVVLYEKDFN